MTNRTASFCSTSQSSFSVIRLRRRSVAKLNASGSSWSEWERNAVREPWVLSLTGNIWRFASLSRVRKDDRTVRNINRIAEVMGAEVIGRVPETGGGAFGAARLNQFVRALHERLQPSRGVRPGRPTSKDWVFRSKIAMSRKTRSKLQRLAKEMSTRERKVSPMQVAAQLLEEAAASCSED